jgi:hypothetical protein
MGKRMDAIESRLDAVDDGRLLRCIEMAMGCLDPEALNPDERLAWWRLLDAKQGREPRAAEKA